MAKHKLSIQETGWVLTNECFSSQNTEAQQGVKLLLKTMRGLQNVKNGRNFMK